MVAYLSPSKLEVYRKYVEGKPEFITQEVVIAAIRGDREWKPALDLGSGFHLALEKGPERYWQPQRQRYLVCDRELANDQVFTQAQMNWVLRYRQRYAGMTHEVPVTWERVTRTNRRFVVRMRIDGMYGLEVHEHKTTSRPPDYEQYERSLQWRLYLAATGAQLCQYNVFEFLRAEPGQEAGIAPVCFQLFPYAGMEAELLGWVEDYLDFVELHKLQAYVYKSETNQLMKAASPHPLLKND
jgi:hypothetical protein